MTDVPVRLLITAEGEAAESELRALGYEVRRVGEAAAGATAGAGPAVARIGEQSRIAAGQVGNLTAQFNDIGIMMAAGQNPLQLAIQQGTQISQVLGPLGAGGAVRALGSAFVGMLNPISLITIGSIAAGAAMVQWLTSAGDGAEDLDEALDELRATMDAYQKTADIARMSTEELEEKFGSASAGIRLTIDLLEQIARSEAQRKIDGINASLAELMSISGAGDRKLPVLDFFDIDFGLTFSKAAKEAKKDALELAAEFINQRDALGAAAGNLDAQIAAMRGLLDVTTRLADASDGRSVAEEAIIKDLAQTLLMMEEQRGKVEEIGAAQRAEMAARAQAQASRVASEQFLANAHEREAEAMAKIYRLYVESRVQSDAQKAAADALLDTFTRQNAIRAAEVRFGRDSAEAENARAEAARAALEEQLAGMEVAESLKEAIRQALEDQLKLAEVDIASGIGAAAAEARALKEALGISLESAVRLAALGPQGVIPRSGGGRGGDPRTQGGSFLDWQTRDATAFLANYKVPTAGGGSGGGSDRDSFASLSAEADKALADLTLAIAGINEKVAAGLKTTGEGQEAVRSAIASTADQIADLIPRLDQAAEKAGPGAKAKVAELRAELKGLAGDLNETARNLSKTFSDSLGRELNDFTTGTQKAGDAFADFGRTVLGEINRIIAQRFTQRFITPLIDSLFSFLPAGLGGAPSAPSLGGAPAGLAPPLSLGQASLTRPAALAPGAFRFGSGSVGPNLPNAAGTPTPVTINVNNGAPGVEARASARSDSGGVAVEIMIEQIEAGIAANVRRGVGPVSDVLGSTFGLGRVPR